MSAENIFVLGGDGYLGWPLSIELALKYPSSTITIVDNLTRRNLVKRVNGNSLTAIYSLPERVKEFKNSTGQNNLKAIELDILSPEFVDLIKEKRPQLIYHLAQQPSAHYSMRGVEEAAFTLRNNEEGNLRLLFTVREFVPDAHLVKLGSFGEYAQCGLDIAEGYFQPQYKSKLASKPTLFPRESDDIYHISKINDTNFISMACRNWQLKVTDIMQATIFGTYQTINPKLTTRFDYDEFFGTVLNRFLAQVVIGQPLSVYGSGNQRTGLMALSDALNSLLMIAESDIQKGQHKVINHVIEKCFSINELAELVQQESAKLGWQVEIDRGNLNPRQEDIPQKMEYNIETNHLDHLDQTWPASDIKDVISEALSVIENYRDRINHAVIMPTFSWQPTTTIQML